MEGHELLSLLRKSGNGNEANTTDSSTVHPAPGPSNPAASVKEISAKVLNLSDAKWEPGWDFRLLDLFNPSTVSKLRGKQFIALIDKTEQTTHEYLKTVCALDPRFLGYHKLDVLPYDHPSRLPKDCFFAKWYRPVSQEEYPRYMEERIAAGRPYDRDNLDDPASIGLDHKRFRRSPTIFRDYEPLATEPLTTKEPGAKDAVSVLRCAALECVSCYFTTVGDASIGIVVFDEPRVLVEEQHRYEVNFGSLIDKGGESKNFPCFKDEIPFIKRFEAALFQSPEVTSPEGAVGYPLAPLIRSTLVRTILDDTSEVLSRVDATLDLINMTMSLDERVKSSERGWRDLFGKWKNGLTRQGKAIDYCMKAVGLDPAVKIQESIPEHGGPQNTINKTIPTFLPELKGIREDVEQALRRTEATFTSLMATMSIIESRRAIAQAEVVTKLTNLAFFFIPLTLSATVFGMNVEEFEGKIKVWIWVTTSLAVTTVTYTTLFWREILAFIEQSPILLTTVTYRKLQAAFLSVAYGMGEAAGSFFAIAVLVAFVSILLSGFGIGFWGLPTDTSKTLAISFGMSLGCTAIFVALLGLRRQISRKREGYNPAPTSRSTAERVPPSELFGTLGRSSNI